MLGQAARCAEPSALSAALSAAEPARAVAFIGAVNRRGEVIPPCGLCRELLLDFTPDAWIAVPDDGDFAVARLSDLIPVAYKAGRRATDGV